LDQREGTPPGEEPEHRHGNPSRNRTEVQPKTISDKPRMRRRRNGLSGKLHKEYRKYTSSGGSSMRSGQGTKGLPATSRGKPGRLLFTPNGTFSSLPVKKKTSKL